MIFHKPSTNHYPLSTNRGFSLIELLVVIAIFFIILGVTLFKQSKFSSDILITNTAYDIALSIREAQVLGAGSRETGAVDNIGYGISFQAGNTGSYFMFTDGLNADGTAGSQDFIYNSGANGEALEQAEIIPLLRKQTIADFCGVNNATYYCSADPLPFLHIAFRKPDLDARITATDADGFLINTFNEARIMVKSTLGDKCRVISVNKVGSVSVLPLCKEANSCDCLRK